MVLSFWPVVRCVGLGVCFFYTHGDVGASAGHATPLDQVLYLKDRLPLMPGLRLVPHHNGYAPVQGSVSAQGFHGTMAESVIVAEGENGMTEQGVAAYYQKTLQGLGWSDEGQNTFSHGGKSVTIEAFDSKEDQRLMVYFHYHQKMDPNR